ncbi:MAG: CpsD/CapB family tyrosine-protein kinase [Planctomycetes bacterium]|nr:CpsD/CapB family tyrosine-protein kinase [Planctomycetota bacterium]
MSRNGLSRQGLIRDPQADSPLVRSYVTLFEQVSVTVGSDEGAPVIVVTSPSRGDGRSTVAANLAICAAALGGCRTLAVDADLDRPGLSKLLGSSGKPGLADVLAGKAECEEFTKPVGHGNLALLPAGRGSSPLIVAQARRVRELVGIWRSRFDWIVVDSPPMLVSAAAAVLAKAASGALLVLRAGRTRPEVLDAALARLDEGCIRTLGAVLNRRRFAIPTGRYRRL